MKHRFLMVLFMAALVGVGILNFLFPNRQEVSELENRALAKFPVLSVESFFSGDFFSGVESYYADHTFNRENLVMMSQSINHLRGLTGKDNVEFIDMGSTDEYAGNTTGNDITDNTDTAANTGTGNVSDTTGSVNVSESDASGSTSENGSTSDPLSASAAIKYQEIKQPLRTASNLNQRVRNYAKKELDYFADLEPLHSASSVVNGEIQQFTITNDETLQGGRKNGLLVVGDTCYEIFGYGEKACTYYANAISSFQSQLEATDKVYSIVVPSHIEFIQSEKYRKMAMSQADAINFINSQFNSQVRPVNIYSSLAEHAEEYLYFRSDHHWTALGAYYAYTSFATAIGDKPYELSAFEHKSVEGFLGTLYNKSLSQEVKKNPDTVDIYMPFIKNKFTIYTKSGSVLKYDLINMSNAKVSNKYLVFISGDNPLSIIDTDLDNGKKIMVFKDSYGNAFIPYLTSHYDQIYIIDPRHYSKGAISLAKENGIHEFLFINSATVIAGNTGFAKNIYKVSY